MELKERISVMLQENHLKQKELAALMGVTEGYVSALLSGRNRNISVSVANLLEEKLGYRAQWLLSGEGPKRKPLKKNPDLSDAYRQVISQMENMSEAKIRAVLAFINSLDEIERILSEDGGE